MRSYPMLRGISVLFKVIAAIQLILGLTSFVMLLQEKVPAGAEMTLYGPAFRPYGVLIGTLLTFLVLWAAADLIMVMVRLGRDVSVLVQRGGRGAAETLGEEKEDITA